MNSDDTSGLELDLPPRRPSSPAPRRCAVHDRPLSPDGLCLACRQAEDERLETGLDLRAVLGVTGVVAGLCAAAVVGLGDRARSFAAELLGGEPEGVVSAAEVERLGLEASRLTCSVGNGPRRDGLLYVPRRAADERLGLVLAFHGSNGRGAAMVARLRTYADANRLVIVAPDSAASQTRRGYHWSVGERPGEHTENSDHIAACLDDAVTLLGGALEPNGWFALGHSGGGSSAPFLATNDARFAAFAVLHGGVFETGLGAHRPRGWFSTGAGDSMRPPAMVREHADRASAALGEPVVFRVFPGGHSMSGAELDAVFAFFEGPG